ncbi:MAG: hypothetical protein HY860_07020 [Chlamydiales bacterium]|nr:hypothetical protein [Chlamydiales bacterium]
MDLNIVLFGESEKGSFQHIIVIDSITKLCDVLGNPPGESLGIGFAVQTLLFRNKVFYKRVEEEGFHTKDYHLGLKLITDYEEPIDGIYMPGVGDKDLIQEAQEFCNKRHALLLINDRDFYDFLTS